MGYAKLRAGQPRQPIRELSAAVEVIAGPLVLS